ncbi:DUF3995 domain-containing protein [Mesorhizobium sp. CAU 1732]|uniref:DUF3995 domain-containing protein n=1 Tax=Mesorhizobium sp. CAU 1732 TaxID=3140358 RepID=UPI0032614DD5
MIPVAVLLAFVLTGLAAIHVYWAMGGVWPGTDEKSCARAIAGFKGIDRMPGPGPSFFVAAILFATAVLALVSAGIVALPLTDTIVSFAAFAAALVFLGRGIAGFTPAWRRLTPEMPFASNDRRWYSPLCLLVGAGFTLLASQGFAT